uniref:Ig-like domain-containing protein n=1 Tax=uncultured Methanobrevibacter sp. TaxID=253161 RepID=UPI00260B1E8A
PISENHDIIKYYKNGTQYTAKVYNKDGTLAVGKNVTFNINGVFYNRVVDKNGMVTLAINLNPGKYIITAIFDGYAVGNNVTVKNVLLTKDLSMKHRDGSKFNATVLDGQGKPLANVTVTFNVNGVFYNRTTDSNGVASLAINLLSGEYIITSIWEGYQVGNKITIK